MPWLVRDGKVLATLEVATSMRDRTRGLLGRDAIDGAILLRPAKSVHTFRMRFAIDVAFCDRDLQVLKVTTLARNRATRPVMKAHAVIESEAGTMARWGVRVGDKLDIRGLDDDEPRPGGTDGTPDERGIGAGNGAVIDVRDAVGGAGRHRDDDGSNDDDSSNGGGGDQLAHRRAPGADVVDGDGARGRPRAEARWS